MPEQELSAAVSGQHEEVLTLAEAASYLRVTEDAVAEIAAQDAIPAQRIAGEWRFLKRALADWLRHGRRACREFAGYPPPWLFGFPPMEEWLAVLETRLLAKLSAAEDNTPKPGTKQAVQKYFGIWRDDPTAEAMLADLYKRRGGTEGEE